MIACYLLATVVLTSWSRVVLPWRWWCRIRLLSVSLWALSSVHTALAGIDLTDPVIYWGGVTVTGMVAALVMFRLNHHAMDRCCGSLRRMSGTCRGYGRSPSAPAAVLVCCLLYSGHTKGHRDGVGHRPGHRGG